MMTAGRMWKGEPLNTVSIEFKATSVEIFTDARCFYRRSEEIVSQMMVNCGRIEDKFPSRGV